MEFNRKVDDALPLDSIITPDPKLRAFLQEIDTTKVKMWLFTNAYITHGKRIVSLLGVEDLFEGITYCDYEKVPLVCKPHEEMFEKAEVEAGAPSMSDCYFVGTRHRFSFLFNHHWPFERAPVPELIRDFSTHNSPPFPQS